MKQLWSAVLLLAGMVVLLAWNGHHIMSEIQPLQQSLDEAVFAAKAGEWEQAEDLTKQVRDNWKGKLPYLYLVQSHRDVDEITILLDESLEYTASQTTNTYAAVNARIQGLMEGIHRIETVSISTLM